jgi:hypothetical protein
VKFTRSKWALDSLLNLEYTGASSIVIKNKSKNVFCNLFNKYGKEKRTLANSFPTNLLAAVGSNSGNRVWMKKKISGP